MTFFIFILLCGVLSALIAAAKHQNYYTWFFNGLCFGPFTVLYLMFSNNKQR